MKANDILIELAKLLGLTGGEYMEQLDTGWIRFRIREALHAMDT